MSASGSSAGSTTTSSRACTGPRPASSSPRSRRGSGCPCSRRWCAGSPVACSRIGPLEEVAGDAALLLRADGRRRTWPARSSRSWPTRELRRRLAEAGRERARGVQLGADGRGDDPELRARARRVSSTLGPWRDTSLPSSAGRSCSALPQAASSEREASAKPRILVFTKTAGFRHESIPAAIAAVRELGAANGLTVDATEDSAAFTDANLARYEAVVFLMTTGDVLDASQQRAFERFIRRGGGFAGVHSAADTEYGWPWYGGLVGRVLQEPSADSTRNRPRRDRAPPLDRRAPAHLDANGRVVQLRAQSAAGCARARDARRDELLARARRDGRRPPDRLVARLPRRTRLVHGRRAHARSPTPTRFSGATPRRDPLRGGTDAPEDPPVSTALRGRRLHVGLRYRSCRPCAGELRVRGVLRTRLRLADGREARPPRSFQQAARSVTVTLTDPKTGVRDSVSRRILVR